MTQSELLSKVSTGVLSICGLEFDFSGNHVPSFSGLYQNFFDTQMTSENFVKNYFSSSSISLSEDSSQEAAGIKYQQKLTWSFPNNDKNRSIRINEIQKVKFVKLVLTDGSRIVLGRNDFFQNARPVILTESDHLKTVVTFNFKSIFSFGFLEGTDTGYLFPLDFPITFINL